MCLQQFCAEKWSKFQWSRNILFLKTGRWGDYVEGRFDPRVEWHYGFDGPLRNRLKKIKRSKSRQNSWFYIKFRPKSVRFYDFRQNFVLGKGTTVATMKKKIPKAVTWSNGNIFRSITLYAFFHEVSFQMTNFIIFLWHFSTRFSFFERNLSFHHPCQI